MPVSVPMPMSELCDRFTIARIKQQRLTSAQANQQDLNAQIDYYKQGIEISDFTLGDLIQKLEKINGKMWDAEYNIRRGLDDDAPMEEIGRRALVIRGLNLERIAVKNQIAAHCKQAEFTEVKRYYMRDSHPSATVSSSAGQ